MWRSCDCTLQEQVDHAPPFPEVLEHFRGFLAKHQLIDAATGRRLARFCFCSDGPYDVRDFVVKQCFISKAGPPTCARGASWLPDHGRRRSPHPRGSSPTSSTSVA